MPGRAALLATTSLVALLALAGVAQAAASSLPTAKQALAHAEALFERGSRAADAGPNGATIVLRDLAATLHDLPEAERRRAESLLARPDDGDADPFEQGYRTAAASPFCTTHVCIHWVATTSDAPPAVDADGNGLPDQVDVTARVLEEVWQKEVVEYGYRPPKSDLSSANHGPDERPDVYLADIGNDGLYGYCTTDDPVVGPGLEGPWDVSAYCVLDNDYSPDQFFGAATGDDALRVTAAHEFFHAIQFAYDFYEDTWMLEGTAVWMEDEVYDDVDDNYQYLGRSALSRPDIPLDFAIADPSHPLGGYQYGAFVFWRFLAETYGGPDVIRRAWEYADGSAAGPDQYSLQAVNSALRERRSSLRAAFARFGAVNASPARFYEEGAAYPTPPDAFRTTLSSRKRRASGEPLLDHLTTWYGVFRPAPGLAPGAKLRLALDLPSRARGAEATLVVYRQSGQPRLIPLTLDRNGDVRRLVPFSRGRVKAVELVLSNASGRFHCWEQLPLACQGAPVDDARRYRFEARLVGL